MITKPEQIKTNGKQLLSIPNTEEGKAFYKQFRRFFNKKKYHVHKHGRGGGEGRHSGGTTLSKSKWFAVYLDELNPYPHYWRGFAEGKKCGLVEMGKPADITKGDLAQLIEKTRSEAFARGSRYGQMLMRNQLIQTATNIEVR